jgi:tetratricopeptide (TPR) repeat protein
LVLATWTQTYERPFDPEAVFNLQDDLVPRIVSTVADWYGVLPHTMSLTVRSKDPALLTPYEALLRSFSYAERVTAEKQVAAKAALKRAVEQSPNSSDCWAMLSILQTDGNIHGLDPAPDSLDDALQSAQRAVDIAPTNHKAYQALAWVRYFRKEFQPSQKAAERAIALNPMDGGALVYVGQTRLGARLLSRSACYGIESQPCRLVLVHAFPQCVSQERLPRGARLRSEDQHARLPAGVHRARGCSRSAGRNRRRPTRSARTADIATELRLAGTR